jgi:translation initiation factor 1
MSKKKKFTDFSELAKHVFAENPDYVPEPEKTKEFTIDPKNQYLEAHFSKKGRGGKVVTVIKGFEGDLSELKKLGKELKNKIGVGGSVKNGEIIIQGNNRDKVVDILQNKGFKVKKIGG